jgi:hypothetical protein
MNEESRRRIIVGAVLILLGIAWFALQFTQGFGDAAILFLIGGAFVAGYFYRRAYGFLIPGCILLGLGLGSVGESTFFGVSDFSQIGLGVGFLAIYVIDRVYRGSTSWWPLIPGGILVVTGIATLSENLGQIIEVGWPLILVLVGLLLIGGAFGLFGRKESS